jgi:low affinity Fe/Cu permease
MKNAFGIFALWMNRAASTPLATVLAFLLVVTWALSGPRLHYSDFWQLVMNTTSSVITFLMVFVLNYAQNRDTNAINTKLDALILAVERADNRVVGLERLPHTEAEAMQEEVRSLKAIADEVQSIAEEHEGG